jgi:hypothetical protein
VDPAALGTLVQALSSRNWYACLESRPRWFVQVGIGPNAGNVPAGKFALEYREGAPGRHRRTLVSSLVEVVAAFEEFCVRGSGVDGLLFLESSAFLLVLASA